MKRNPLETIMGVIVLVIAASFMAFAYKKADPVTKDSYTLTARFMKVGGIAAGNDVMINGVKVGTITSVALDDKDYTARVTMAIRGDIKLPSDTMAAITDAGIMGGKYIKLEPGKAKTYLSDKETIKKVKDYRSLEDMVGEMIFLSTK